jgi:uncharacterized protein YndB with AHSA1/START domain
MAIVVNSVRIDGPIERVYDLVTTTKYWPQWHPATVGVSGVTERPVVLGDVVREQARIGAQVYEGDWTVVEHVRPSRLVLSAGSGRLQISYTFRAMGDVTEFVRELEFNPEDFARGVPNAGDVETLMHRQSEAGLQKLKQLVEDLLSSD